MSSHLIEALQSAANRNRELLTILHQTDYANTSQKQNATYITDLEGQIQKTNQEITRLHRITEDERKDHLSYQESTFKRYLHKMGGSKGQAKFSAKAEKEEREFMEAWQKEREAQESLAEMKRALGQAQSDHQRFESDRMQFDRAQQELDMLYSSIFSGPTPEVPGEDQLEQSLNNNKQWFDQVQCQFQNDQRASNALQYAQQSLEKAAKDMGDARSASTFDMFGGGGFSDMMERDALSRAQVGITQCQRHMDEARHCQSSIPQLSAIDIDHGHFVSDVLFDNIFSDMAQHDRIKSSERQVHQALEQLTKVIGEQKQRLSSSRSQMDEAKRQVGEARWQLQSIRGEAFDRFAGAQGAPPPAFVGEQAPPPAYPA